ncbi:hypothetical protein AVEN_32115-1 [Araneus ventricosus]|uniref:Uncharacterized protein n=1 Tax=Araneus ventricosus TaxID=182803 RepID=A0A4Y2GEH6_ARAVE|nr:hypothetical protein AVEN_32115-1 [Araneus ventricosus]
MTKTTPELALSSLNFFTSGRTFGALRMQRGHIHGGTSLESDYEPGTLRPRRNQSIGQYLSVHKDSFSNPPTNRRLEEAVVGDRPKMMKFKAL